MCVPIRGLTYCVSCVGEVWAKENAGIINSAVKSFFIAAKYRMNAKSGSPEVGKSGRHLCVAKVYLASQIVQD